MKMKLKHGIWLLIATHFITTGNPLIFNGLDLLGYMIAFYTLYKIFISNEFQELFN